MSASEEVHQEFKEDVASALKEEQRQKQEQHGDDGQVNGVAENGVEHHNGHHNGHQEDEVDGAGHSKPAKEEEHSDVSSGQHAEVEVVVHHDQEAEAPEHSEPAEHAEEVVEEKKEEVPHKDTEEDEPPVVVEAHPVIAKEEVVVPALEETHPAAHHGDKAHNGHNEEVAAEADTGESPVRELRQKYLHERQSSEEMKREVEAESRPRINKAAMSTSVDEKSVREAYEDVRSDTTKTDWAVFKFEAQKIVCSATGEGFDSFREHFADDERAFGFIRIQMGDEMSKRQKFVFLTWVGPQVSVIRRAKMTIDKGLVKDIIKNFAVELQVESQSEINVDYIREQLARAGGANYGTGFRD